MTMYNIISKKRDGQNLTREEISFFVKGAASGDIPDYQLSALLMAIYIRGFDLRETIDLTSEMVLSGELVDLSLNKNLVFADKHSTGGVGDKISLIALPLAAAVGVKIAKLAGRSLGHTGGTIDKLSAIPGFNTSLKFSDFIQYAVDTGLAISSQTINICPADKKLYALRDVTATVDYLPLIAASVMSKKLASGASAIVLDVKSGNGAFMKSEAEAIQLAEIMVGIAKNEGKRVAAIVSDMSVPLGRSVGNSLEVIEAIEVLKNNIDGDIVTLSRVIASYMVYLSGITDSFEQAQEIVKQKHENGDGLSQFKQFISNQSGDIRVVDDYAFLPQCKERMEILAEKEGYIEAMDTQKIGFSAIECGAGRHTKEQEIDLGAGLDVLKKTGDYVMVGEVLAVAYFTDKDRDGIKKYIKEAYYIGDNCPEKNPIIHKIIQ